MGDEQIDVQWQKLGERVQETRRALEQYLKATGSDERVTYVEISVTSHDTQADLPPLEYTVSQGDLGLRFPSAESTEEIAYAEEGLEPSPLDEFLEAEVERLNDEVRNLSATPASAIIRVLLAALSGNSTCFGTSLCFKDPRDGKKYLYRWRQRGDRCVPEKELCP
jgi:hypothetical protein